MLILHWIFSDLQKANSAEYNYHLQTIANTFQSNSSQGLYSLDQYT